MKTLPQSIIDFHVHLFPDKIFDAIWEEFDSHNAPVIYKLYYRECIEFLTIHNVNPIVYSNYAHKKGISEPLNEWNLKVLDVFPNLYCFIPCHPDDDNAIHYVEQMISHPRVAGIKLHCHVQQVYPHDERLFPLYEMMIEKKKHILLHAGTGPATNKFVGYANFKRLLDQFPDLPVTVAHMGGYEYKEFIGLLDEHPNMLFDTAYSFIPDSPWFFTPGKEYLEKYKDKILYGSDFPNMVLPRETEIEYLQGLNLSDEFYSRVFRKNGLRLLSETCPIK